MKSWLFFLLFILSVDFSHAETTSSIWSGLHLQITGQANFRHSVDKRFATAFPFTPEQLPAGQSNAFLETVDPGSQYEISDIIINGSWQFNKQLSAFFTLEIVDRYDRNPTSSDHEADLDTIILRYGKKHNAWQMPEQGNYYMQIGKFGPFERQNDRHLQSYGLVSTVFNRFEDSGIELGINFKSGFYSMFAVTTGNPLFMRDPNALAGDNGTPDRLTSITNPDPNIKSGLPVFYDAEVERFDLSAPQLALGLGWRIYDETNHLLLNVLAWGNERELQNNRSLNGTFYGADLDLLDISEVPVPGGPIRLDITETDKNDYGLNIWLYYNNFSFFGQYAYQEIAGMERTGWETEFAYHFRIANLPLLRSITPVVRYSKLNPKFTGSSTFPAPSVFWDWQKVDYGLRIELGKSFEVTFEYADNEFIRAGKKETQNEYLVTFIWKRNILN